MKKVGPGDFETQIARFLFHYRNTPHSTTVVSPSELLMGRRPRSVLDMLRPDVSARVFDSRQRQKISHDVHAKPRSFELDDNVFARNFETGLTWLAGIVTEKKGSLAYYIHLHDGRVVRQHIDHVRARSCDSATDTDKS